MSEYQESIMPRLTWPEFISQVQSVLEPTDVFDPFDGNADRLQAHIRQVCIEMQRMIPAYQHSHIDRISNAEAPDYCNASKGVLPRGAIHSLYVQIECPMNEPDEGEEYEDESGEGYGYEDYLPCESRQVIAYQIPWASRRRLAQGHIDYCWDLMVELQCSSCEGQGASSAIRNWNRRHFRRPYFISVNPANGDFLLTPKLKDDEYLLVEWTGFKTIFNSSDLLGWGSEAVPTAAAYVKYMTELEKREKMALADRYKRDYQDSLGLLYTQMKPYESPDTPRPTIFSF